MSPSICPLPVGDDAAAPQLVATSAAPDPTADAAPGPATTSAPIPTPPLTVDWSKVRLGVDPAPIMFVANWSAETCCWDGGELVPYGPLSLLPAAQVLNYGQSIFEGLKAYRSSPSATTSTAAATPTAAAEEAGAPSSSPSAGPDAAAAADRVLLFRPDANAARFEAGAARMCMPPVPPAMFLAALHAVVRANKHWVPPPCRGSLYLRPLLLGTGPLLGLCPAPSYTFVVYAMPVGGRAKEGRLTALDYLIHDSLHRAAPRGVGSTKAAGNYSPCLMAQAQARAQGCADCIYLDAKSDTYLEEGSGCNVFAAHGSVITTPPAAGSILPGITRASLLQLAGALGYGVREAPISVEDALRADEMFASGTAVVVQPIGSVTFKGSRVRFCGPEASSSASTTTTTADPSTAAATTSTAAVTATDGGDAVAEAEADGHTSEGEGDVPSSSRSESSSCCASGISLDAAGGILSYGYDSAVVKLSDEQRAALAAAVPPPLPGSLPLGVGPIAQRLYSLLTGIQYGRAPDPYGWAVAVEMEGPTEGPLNLDRELGLIEEGEEEEETDQEVAVAEEKMVAAVGADAAALVGAVKAKVKAGGGKRRVKSVFADPNLE